MTIHYLVPKVTQEHLETRREQLLDAAVRCFAAEGFHRTTMVDIAREAGLSTGASYRYFDSKEAIIEAIADERHAREADILLAAAEREDGAALLSELAEGYFAMLDRPGERQRRHLGIQVWAEGLRNPRVRKLVRDGVDNSRRAFEQVLRRARDDGELPAGVDLEAGARVMVALYQGFILQRAFDPTADLDGYVGAVQTIIDSLALAGDRDGVA